MVQFGLRIRPVKREIPSASLCRKSPLLAQRTREKWGTRDFHFLWWAAGPWALRAGSSLRLKNGYAQDDKVV